MNIKLFIYLINFLLILWFIFYQNKDYRNSIKWLFLFLLIPLFSFVIYYFIGQGIKVNKKKYKVVEQRINNIFTLKSDNKKCIDSSLEKLIATNISLCGSNMTYYNDVYYFLDGDSYYSSLINDIRLSKSSIHIEIYIFRDDSFGETIMDLLLQKASKGIKVKLLYDPNGNLLNKKGFLKRYKHPNLKIVKHYPHYYQVRNYNYRNHRKIIIIDGKIAYLGGFNFGIEYLSEKDKVAPFRDTQMKIKGEGVYELQKQFLIDFYYAYSLIHPFVDIDVNASDIYLNKEKKKVPMQFVSTSYFIRENVKRSKMKLLSYAKNEVYIQTPYLILDVVMMEQLKLLLLSGVKVNIMIPLKYDKKIPYCATLACARELYNLGAKIYLYEGFIHSKVIIVDDFYLVIGSSNLDVRSFSLNLETDCYIYSYNEVSRYKNIFNIDILNSIEYSPFVEEKLFKSFKIGKRIYRLISSLM